MSKHHKHHKQAHKEVKEVPVFVKRSLAELRKLAQWEREIERQELELVKEIRQFL
ncbi:hypothetical protein [Escherichia coli]|uniref:hypothetical protein n=1 Tax=Escherichia coli TaxID=562 RepID=UPI0018C5BF10|nr:hypothetical protein [Escherichia coli]